VNERPIITFAATVRSAAPAGAVYDLLADPATHLVWAGEQAPDPRFRLLELDGPKGPLAVGATFTSTGASSKNGSMTFHDESAVIEATRPGTFAFQTASRLDRRHRPAWQARFVHRYTVSPDGDGSRVGYTCEVYPQNYRPYWLHPLLRPATRRMVGRSVRRNMENLARMAEAVVAGRAG